MIITSGARVSALLGEGTDVNIFISAQTSITTPISMYICAQIEHENENNPECEREKEAKNYQIIP
jgi:hypothetical protein